MPASEDQLERSALSNKTIALNKEQDLCQHEGAVQPLYYCERRRSSQERPFLVAGRARLRKGSGIDGGGPRSYHSSGSVIDDRGNVGRWDSANRSMQLSQNCMPYVVVCSRD